MLPLLIVGLSPVLLGLIFLPPLANTWKTDESWTMVWSVVIGTLVFFAAETEG